MSDPAPFGGAGNLLDALPAELAGDVAGWAGLAAYRLVARNQWAQASQEWVKGTHLKQGRIWEVCCLSGYKTVQEWRHGLKHGEYKEWYNNGQLREHSHYVDGKLEGEFKEWFRNGQLRKHARYVDGKLEGEYKWWYENGHLRMHCHYSRGIVRQQSN